MSSACTTDHRSPAATPPARTASSESPISRKPTPDNVSRAATHTCGDNNNLVRARVRGGVMTGWGRG
eukprot:scaffold68023_cov76-Phaeocystis_antarctica.AAC.1